MTTPRALLGLAMLLTMSAPAAAHLSAAKFTHVVQLGSPSATLVAVRVDTIVGNMLNGSEALLVNGTEVANLTPLVGGPKVVMPGSTIVFATPAFTATGKGSGDVAMTDAAGATIVAGATLTLRGSFGETAATFIVPAGYGGNTAALGDGTVAQLDAQTVTITGIDGKPILVGTGVAAEMSGGGCSTAGTSSASWQALLLVGLALALLRTRQGAITRRLAPCLVLGTALGCSSQAAPGLDLGPTPTPPSSKIEHVVIVVQENHSFDSMFGAYCKALAGSAPTCTAGATCCEAAPSTEPSGASPIALDDTANGAFDPNHGTPCETDQINGGKMDRFVTSTVCGDARNFAVAQASTAQRYWDLAASGALADRYFQPIIGSTSSNDMYFARAQYVFTDNAYYPETSDAACVGTPTRSFTEATIGDLLVAQGVSFATYAEGYASMQAARAKNECATAAAACPAARNLYPCVFDASDIPFQYYAPFRDNPTYMRDYSALATDLAGAALPSVVWVKALGFKTEHPGTGTTISAGIAFVDEVVQRVQASSYAASTLILVTYDEGGGYFDHVSPPATSAVDGKPYGTRVPLFALGPFAKKGTVSHATLEHSSIVRFLEWNWLAQKTGQLGGRDTVVGNLGSLLDPAATGTPVPE